MVADLRAPTPSAAAELLVPEQLELQQTVDHLANGLNEALTEKIDNSQTRLNYARLQLSDPSHVIGHNSLYLKSLKQKLNFEFSSQQNKYQRKLDRLTNQLAPLNPTTKLELNLQKLKQCKKQLSLAWHNQLNHYQNRFYLKVQALETLSPLSTLNRGYSIVRDKESEQVLSTTKKVKKGQSIKVLMKDCNLEASVSQVNTK
jgi:exodeoxyribonuclease VII large subunit